MSAKPCDRCTMIMVNYTDLWLIHSHIAGLIDSAWLELRELKIRSTLLGACTSCRCLDLIWRLRPLRLRILSTNLIILLTTQSHPLLMKHMFLSRVSFSMLPKRTPSFNKRLTI
jgi:hypothetical protein